MQRYVPVGIWLRGIQTVRGLHSIRNSGMSEADLSSVTKPNPVYDELLRKITRTHDHNKRQY